MPLKCHFSYFSYAKPPNPKVKSLKMGHSDTVGSLNKGLRSLLRSVGNAQNQKIHTI